MSRHSVVTFSKASSCLGFEPLKLFRFPVEDHRKVLFCSVQFSSLLVHLTVGSNTLAIFILRQICQSCCVFPFPCPLTCRPEAVNLFIGVFCLRTLTVGCKAPLTACRECLMKEALVERKTGSCCCLFPLSAPLEA